MGDIDGVNLKSSSGAAPIAAAVDAVVANNIDEGDTDSSAEAAKAEAIAAVEAVATAEAIAAAEEAAAAQALAAKEAAADAAMGSVLGIGGAEGHDDAYGDDGEKAREKWNPLSYAYPLLRWLLSA